MCIFIIGDRNKNTALVSNDDRWDFTFDFGNPGYYTQNADWSRTPKEIQVSTNGDLLYEVLFSAKGDDKVFYLSREDDERWGSYSKWVRLDDGVFNVGTVCRTRYPQAAKAEGSIARVAMAEYVGAANEHDIAVLYNVDNDARYGVGSGEVNEMLRRCGRIVVRSSVRMLDKNESFIAWIRQNGDLAPKTDLLVSSGGMRRAGLNVRRCLSWEQLAEETMDELQRLESVSQLHRVIVSYHGEGCLIFEPSGDRHLLIYSPRELEGDGEASVGHAAFGTRAIMTAAATCAGPNPSLDDLAHALVNGLIANRMSLERGLIETVGAKGEAILTLRREEVANCLKHGDKQLGTHFSTVDLETPRDDNPISIVTSVGNARGGQLQLAREYLESGPSTLLEAGIPMLEIERMRTFERREIEGLSNLRRLLKRHVEGFGGGPISLCVFGSPGSGKSFAVREVARSVGVRKPPLEFNLSQMRGYDDLVAAFHKVGSEGLRGRPPLVFFDEFDASLQEMKFGWLKYFLAPMQDGVFRDGTSEYSLGRAILVFAGGTSANFENFEKEAGRADVATKAPDFASRIQGFVDISGINSLPEDGPIPYLRRAVLLRSMILGKMAPSDGGDRGRKLRIDPRVADAFLMTRKFKHDARSMRAIVESSSLSSGATFTPACIENNCLNLHVSEDFSEYLSGTYDSESAI